MNRPSRGGVTEIEKKMPTSSAACMRGMDARQHLAAICRADG